jgi:dihydropteroate synthase
MAIVSRPLASWQLRTRSLALGERTLVMGIVNVTPDSFSGDGELDRDRAVEQALRMLDEGAAILDFGGESTRPGSQEALTDQQEQDRVLPVLEAVLAGRPGSVTSMDTYRAATARAGVAAGAEIVNDVSGFLWDPAMAEACAELGCGVVLMHTRGRPSEWKTLPPLADEAVTPLVLRDLAERRDRALAAGIAPERIVLDPGYGFGKAFDANYPLLAAQDTLLALGHPLLAGVSRKSFLGRTLAVTRRGVDAPADAREAATIAATVAAVLNGASIVRVHNVRPAVEAVTIADAILEARSC